jgi:hypothetical protein
MVDATLVYIFNVVYVIKEGGVLNGMSDRLEDDL